MSIRVTWRSMHDNNVCPRCEELDGHEWIVESGKGGSLEFLHHPVHGVVASASEGSLVPHEYGKCRCYITYDIEWGDLIPRLTRIRDNIKASLEAPETVVTQI